MEVEEKEAKLKPGRKRCSKEEKESYYKGWKASGLSQGKFCKANHLAVPTFSSWVRQIEKDRVKKLSFIPLETICDDEEEKRSVEIEFLNGIKCRVGLSNKTQTSVFIRELHRAFTVD